MLSGELFLPRGSGSAPGPPLGGAAAGASVMVGLQFIVGFNTAAVNIEVARKQTHPRLHSTQRYSV